MGLPSDDDRPPGAANGGNYYDDQPSIPTQEQSAPANGQANLPLRSYASTEVSAQTRDRGDSVADPRERMRREGSRRPSGQQRVCGKCGRGLTGQFVRALGDTYHLECFTCHVRSNTLPRDGAHDVDNVIGLRQNRRIEILPRARPASKPIPSLRDRLLPPA